MRALVVYESMFGNTKAVAEAVAEGLAAGLSVEVTEVGNAPVNPAVDLLVVGGPTHAFGISTAGTRRSAADQADGPLVSTGPGLREWLAGAAPHLAGVAVATFDTRINRPRLPGSAARALRRRLHKHGCRPIAPPASFYVTGTRGPLLATEVTRAQQWGAALATAAAAPAVPNR